MSKMPKKAVALRSKAEVQIAGTPTQKIPVSSTEELLHELRVHQIELEMQNEELRQSQLALEESRDRYVDLYEFAPVGYLSLTRDGMIAEANLTASALLGVERKKLLKRRFAGLIADGSDQWHLHFAHALKHDSVQRCELLLKRSDNTDFHAQLDCVHMRGDSTSPMRIALTDITERKLADEELRIAAITFQTNDGIIVTDAKGVILRVNHAFTRLTGYSEQEAVGQTPAMLKSGRQDKDFYVRMWSTLKHKHYWQGEMWNRRKNGKIYAEWLTISGVLSPEGRVTHYVGSFSDITKDSEAEAEIHRLAYYDPLTQLPNRRLLIDRLSQALTASRRSGHYGALLFLDLDNFKTLNDTRGQLQLHYQVQIDQAHSAIGAEALLRWQHPERGNISPAQFIPLAEETGLIFSIGLWVLETACAQIKAWSSNPITRGLQLAINVSARQFRQANFVDQVQQTLAANNIDPQRLKIELTESLVLDNVSDTIIKMNTLKEMGVSLSMDDFGTGYSSLSYLKLLPLDQLKIDQSFVRNVATDPNDAAIVKAIITMGNAFGLHVIAEGVETSEQHEFLDQHGCHGYQGFLFGKPLPIEQFDELVLQRA